MRTLQDVRSVMDRIKLHGLQEAVIVGGGPLALEWARFGIAVNCVAPGGVNTRMTSTIPEKIIENLLKSIPFRRFAEPEEIAAVHAFLASKESAYITGHTIFVDGGASLGA